MTPITVDSLYAWLALPVGTNLLVDALSEARERYTDQLGRLLFDAADLVPQLGRPLEVFLLHRLAHLPAQGL